VIAVSPPLAFYASLLIRHGESVKTVQARLGHASAAETLDTYGHL
jgi:integrase